MQPHLSVALDRCIELLAPAIENKSAPVIVDATLGFGGHSKELLSRFPQLRIIGLDRDKSALDLAEKNVDSPRLTAIHSVYDQISDCVHAVGFSKVDGILFDLGVSSMQLDEVARGFSYAHDARIDMRMDQSSGITAYEVLMTYSKNDLVRILREYGEERFAPRIVDRIIENRHDFPNSTKFLAELVKTSIPAATRRTGGNPAKRTFQALRIEVNHELEVLERALPQALDLLEVGGRLVVMSFQSLEDKIVKRIFAASTRIEDVRGIPHLPSVAQPQFTLVTRGSEGASSEEQERNPRSTSMRLRAVERLAA